MLKKYSAYPYLIWSLIFIIVPLILVLYFSFTTFEGVGEITGSFTLENYLKSFDSLYLKVLIRSLKLALIATLVCFILGYPVAAIIAGMKMKRQSLVLTLFVLPMWMNFLLRTYAWMYLLGSNGIIAKALDFIGLGHVQILYNEGAVILGMVYNFIPFMILPIYTVLSKIDKSLIEAAKDLGADRITINRQIIFPLSMPGVISGITMVFMPAVSTFVISSLLGGGQYMLIGNLVEQQFLSAGDWHFGSAISMILMVLILISMFIMNKYEEDEGVRTI